MLQQITANLAGLVRHTKYQGRDYIVVPTVILTEGVHSGSNGPLFYPGDELQRNVSAWDDKPLLVYHAMNLNGEYCSAGDDGVADRQAVGFLKNTRYKNGKLLSNAWIDIAKANKIDSRILATINNSVMMEVSTGLFTENEEKPGDFRGTAYNAIARNYQPDHLALLPDQRGACSIEAGCGLLRLNHAVPPATQDRLKRVIDRIVQSTTRNSNLVYEDRRTQLQQALRDSFGDVFSVAPSPYPSSFYVMDMADDFFIFEGNGKLFKQPYIITDGKAQPTGKPIEVVRSSTYEPVINAKCKKGEDEPTDNAQQRLFRASLKRALNAFCPTGKGGTDEAFDFISENAFTNNIENRVFNKAMRLALNSSASNSSSGACVSTS